MPSSKFSISAVLRELLRPSVAPPAASDASESAAVAAWAARYAKSEAPGSRGRGPGSLGLLAPRRLAVAFGATLMAVVGACALPTTYEVPVGLSVEIRASEGERLPSMEIARYVRERSDATEVEMMMREQRDDDGRAETSMQIRLWDQNLALGEIEPELRELFPSLDGAEIVETALEGEFETNWGRRLAHHAFALSLRDAEFEAVREQVLLDLEARGVTEGAVFVIIHDQGDHRQVEIEQHRVLDLDAGELPEEIEWVVDPEQLRALELRGRDGGREGEDVDVRIEIKRLGH